jgi:hypothetical protein
MKKILLILLIPLIILCFVTNVFALTITEILKYKGQRIIIVQNSNVIPYTINGVMLDIVITRENKTFIMLQTNDYYNYTDGIAFIRLEQIIKIIN